MGYETLMNLSRVVGGIMRVDPGSLDPDENLVERGLDSLGMVELLGALEESFSVTIPPAEITPENFATLAALDRLLARLRAA